MAKKKTTKKSTTNSGAKKKGKVTKKSNQGSKAKSKASAKPPTTIQPMASISSMGHPPADIPVEFLYEAGGYYHYTGSCCSVPLHSSEIVSPFPLPVTTCDPEPPVPPAATSTLEIPRLRPSTLPFRYPAETLVAEGTPTPGSTHWELAKGESFGDTFTFVAANDAPQSVKDLIKAINGTVFAGYAVQYSFENRCIRCNASEEVNVNYLRFFPSEIADTNETESLVVYDCDTNGNIAYLRMKNTLGYTGEFAILLSWF